MKKVLVGMIVCMAAGTAFGAVSSFSLPAVTDFLPGQTVQIPVSVDSQGTTDALVLFAQLSGPFTVEALNLTNGTVFEGNNRFLTIDLYDPQIGYGSVNTLTGPAALVPGSVVAWVAVKANGDLGAVGTISTESADGPSELGFANPGIGQATGALRIIPEPMSALLLLAGLPLLRRRR